MQNVTLAETAEDVDVAIIAPLSDAYPDVERDLYSLARLLVQKGKKVLLFGLTQPEEMEGLLFSNPSCGKEDIHQLLLDGKGGEVAAFILEQINVYAEDCERIINGAGSRVAAYLTLPLYLKHLMSGRKRTVYSVVRFEHGEKDSATRLWAEVFDRRHPSVKHHVVYRERHQLDALKPLIAEQTNMQMVPFYGLV